MQLAPTRRPGDGRKCSETIKIKVAGNLGLNNMICYI